MRPSGPASKAALVEALAKQDRRPVKHTRRTVDRLFALLVRLLSAYGRVWFPGFGVFRVKRVKRRSVVNVADGEVVKLPAARTIKFRKAKGVKV